MGTARSFRPVFWLVGPLFRLCQGQEVNALLHHRESNFMAVEWDEKRYLSRMLTVLLKAKRIHLLLTVVLMILVIALLDWVAGPELPLNGLYVLPMLIAAITLSPRSIVALALACAFLRCLLDPPSSAIQYALHFTFSWTSYVISGLFAVALIRNRKMTLEYFDQIEHEQHLRSEAQEQLKTLVESSPAAILTLNQHGVVLAANHAANVLFGLPPEKSVEGRSIEPYMPVLADALRVDIGQEPFRTSARSQGRRENGDIFLADTCFSTYLAGDGVRLAAIVIDSSEEMRDREEQNLRQLSVTSRIVVCAVLHEVRNLCSAISVVYANLKAKGSTDAIAEFHGLETLVAGLTRVASLELYGRENDSVEEVPLQQVLDDLRIIIEPGWMDIDGRIRWHVREKATRVLADRNGLLQVFLNLAQNSQRAVERSSQRELAITAIAANGRALIRFEDSGCGISDGRHLFQPFQPGAQHTGLGLYISRVLVRAYGGELRFEPRDHGSCFVVELPVVHMRKGNV